jgi:hypothetical protein
MAFEYRPLSWRTRGIGSATTPSTSQVQTISDAIAKAEGYGVANAIPTIRNNPGDLEDASGNIITFPTPQAGMQALNNQVNLMISGQSAHYDPSMTWAQIGAIYSGSSLPNWANNVAAQLGVDPNSTLGDFLGTGGSFPDQSAPSTVTATDTSMFTSGGIDFSSLFSGTGVSWTTWLMVFAAGFLVVYMLKKPTTA